jgi:Tol biopolymer transport system component
VGHRRTALAIAWGLAVGATACTGPTTKAADPTAAAPSDAEPAPDEPIDVGTLTGRLVVTGDDAIWTANADGTGARRLTSGAGPVLDPAWAPDGSRVVYRDSSRGFNVNDEIYAVDADGGGATNLTRNPANDWGPDWSPDGRTIAFNSDREGLPMGGFLVDPDGSNVRRIPTDLWVEYPAWSPDGTRIAFMGGESAREYEIWAIDTDGTDPVQLTDSPGQDGWPAWSPDGERIAFTSVRDDCARSDAPDCRTTDTGEDDPYRDVWVVNADGSGLARVTPEFGQFVTWSPDGQYLLVYGYDLYVIRPDGTGRTPLDITGVPSGVFPDWIE